MRRRWTNGLAIFLLNILLGIDPINSMRSARSDPNIITRRNDARSANVSEFDENMEVLIQNLHTLSTPNNPEDIRSRGADALQPQSKSTGPSPDEIAPQEGTLSTYLNIFNSLYSIYQPILKDRFIESLPGSVVCILSDKPNCGWHGELTKAVTGAFSGPLFSLLAAVKTQTCPLFASSRRSVLTSHLGTDDPTQLTDFQDMLFATLKSNLPPQFSDAFMAIWNKFIDLSAPPIVSFISDVLMNVLQVPVDFLKIGLQFGIEIPNLNESEHCSQGDLKQLLMWGLRHNISWSFGESLLDMFLAPELPPCSYPGCQSGGPFSRSARSIVGDPTVLMGCDQKSLTRFNDTFCAELLSAEAQESSVVHVLCKALGALSDTEVRRVWRNSCLILQSVFLPFLEAECSAGPAETRVTRSALSINQLVCNYVNWSDGGVDPISVTLCSENDREAFIQKACNNIRVMRVLVANPKNAWVWGYCENSTENYMVNQYCAYEVWGTQPLDASVVTFCWNNDRMRLESLLCGSIDFFLLVFSDPQNNWLMPNCTEPPTQVNVDDLVTESCGYADWQAVAQLPTDLISLCIQNDEKRFVAVVCSNATFLNEIVRNSANKWVGEYCSYSSSNPPTDPPMVFHIPTWCNYGTWANMTVDPPVVGLCWQHDRLSFLKGVCCDMALFESLTLNQQNHWLVSACADEEIMSMLAQVCRYSEWNQPTIVDMTDLALCADLDPVNFTRKVCTNTTVLQNLLANLDNTWLLEHCSNLTGSGLENTGGSLMGFKPSEQCQYRRWSVLLPDPALLALCWDYDQANFVSSICTNHALLDQLVKEPSSLWVGALCATYSNYTSHSKQNDSTSDAQPCLARDLVEKLNWSCSADFSAVCQAESSQLRALQLLLRCGVEVLQPRLERLVSPQVAAMVNQATNVWVILLVALEESQLTTLHVTENIRLSVLESVMLHLERETNFENKRILLQCFGKVLTSLMQTGRDGTSNFLFLVKEYFRIPLPSLRAVLGAMDVTTSRQILQYFTRNQSTLNLSQVYLHTMMSVFLHTLLPRDGSLFPDLVPLMKLASPTDISSLPPLQNNSIVLSTINSSINQLSLEQRRAFGRWFSKSYGSKDMTDGGLSFVRDTGNLIAYLPLQSFQHLSPAQLLDGLEILLRNALSPLKQQFVAHSLIGVYRNLTVEQLRRMGHLPCLTDSRQLLAYTGTEAFVVIQDSIRTCVSQGLSVPSDMVSLILNASELEAPASLSPQRLAQITPFLPLLGTDFLQQLSQSQLKPALTSLASVHLTPAQANVIVDKLSANSSPAVAGQLVALGPLVSGLRVETLLSLPSDTLLSALPNISLQTSSLSAVQANAITSRLWGSQEVPQWLDAVEPLLSTTPLLSVLPRTQALVADRTVSKTYTRMWNTQQAKALFQEVMGAVPSPSTAEFLSLGTIAGGVSCNILKQLFLDQTSVLSMRNVLQFLREQPVPLHTSLKKCIVEELYHFDFFSELLGYLGSQIALSLPVSTIKKFPPDMMDVLRRMVVQEPRHFLLLPSIKQALLVDKMIQRLGMYSGEYTEEEFRSLGVMATFVVDGIFEQLVRSFFVESIEFLRGFCYSSSKRDIVARLLQEARTFGPVQTWTSETLSQVDRFIFFLPKDILQEIPAALMSQERIERLFLAQRRWEAGELGSLCAGTRDPLEQQALFEKQQYLLQFFLGFLRVGRGTSTGVIPSCVNLHMTRPAAWSIDSLAIGMTAGDFRACLELIGQDPSFSPFQLSLLLRRTKQLYGVPSTFPESVIAQLGNIASQLTPEELATIRLSELRTISAMGALRDWSKRQLAVLSTVALNSTKQSPGQLNSSTLVALGHIVCGMAVSVIRLFNPVEFSKAALWLGKLRLPCSEEQLEAMVGLLSDGQAFKPISSWGPEVFIEIGSLAVGLPDMAMSALVKEQIEGVTPLAISLIPADKFAVVFHQDQIRMFSYEQAIAVTDPQRAGLTTVQQTALSMVLTPWEDRPVDFRGRSFGVVSGPCPLCHLVGLLMVALLLPNNTL